MMKLFRTKKKILVVEDEPDIAEGLEARLSLANYNVVVAKDGKEAVQKTRSEDPDLIVLDLMMPKIDGYEVCRILKSEQKTRKIPILVLTALSMMSDVEKAFDVGASDFVTKPFSNERLLAKIEKLLEQ